MRLFDYLDSGNGSKVRLLLAQLSQKYDWTNVDIDKGLTRTPELLSATRLVAYRRSNSTTAQPVRVERGRVVPRRRLALRAGDAARPPQVLQWMFFEQYSHEPYIATPHISCATSRPITRVAGDSRRLENGHAALKVIEGHLRPARSS